MKRNKENLSEYEIRKISKLVGMNQIDDDFNINIMKQINLLPNHQIEKQTFFQKNILLIFGIFVLLYLFISFSIIQSIDFTIIKDFSINYINTFFNTLYNFYYDFIVPAFVISKKLSFVFPLIITVQLLIVLYLLNKADVFSKNLKENNA